MEHILKVVRESFNHLKRLRLRLSLWFFTFFYDEPKNTETWKSRKKNEWTTKKAGNHLQKFSTSLLSLDCTMGNKVDVKNLKILTHWAYSELSYKNESRSMGHIVSLQVWLESIVECLRRKTNKPKTKDKQGEEDNFLTKKRKNNKVLCVELNLCQLIILLFIGLFLCVFTAALMKDWKFPCQFASITRIF